MLMAVVVGCAESSQTSKYPADLSGRVTIAEKLVSATTWVPSPMQGKIFWIVQISVKNVSYSQPITNYGWQIVANNVSFVDLRGFPVDILNIASGQSGQATYVFSVPLTIAVEDAQICYKGQEPSSFGELTKKNTVSAYDWSTGSIINVTPPPTIETYLVHGPSVIDVYRYMQLKTIASWQGTSSRKMDFTVTKVPCIINYGWTATSAIRSSVTVYAFDKYNTTPLPWESRTGIGTMELDAAGKYTIQVDAVGAQWWLKIGVEQ
jgi:hypothetical protein